METSLPNLEGRQIILGLSGGVDSAVCAILLKQAGASVQALHMTNWDDDDGYCTAAEDLQDARRICEQLDIPLHHANFAKDYRDRVFDYFLDEYRRGRTPNPDVLCNREIKFGVFRDYAIRLGGEYVATGHYARTETIGAETHLLKGRDGNKDQSYFLHAVREKALAQTVFPLGGLQKSDVRRIAKDYGLVVHGKKDSTGICFIGERPFREFLQNYLPGQPGTMRTPQGDPVGEHIGLMYYTLGQRQGLGIGGRQDASDQPWYVIAKDIGKNTLIVAQGEHEQLFSSALIAGEPNWINQQPELPLRCAAKVRYRQQDQDCELSVTSDGRLLVRFDEPQRAVAPGQYVVFYRGDRCLGGASIDETIQAEPRSLSAS